MSDLSVTAAPEPSISAHLTIDERDAAVLIDMRQRAVVARAKYNASAADTKDKKKAAEGAEEIFMTTFDRIMRRAQGEDLPLFNQSELLDKAKADPVVTKLVDKLLEHGHDVNAIIVAGYTQDERHLAEQYLEALANAKALADTGATDVPTVEIPAFLLPQPLTPIEIADLARRLEAEDLTITAEQIGAWTKAQTAEVMDWLTRCEAIRKAKGEALTMDDLPAAPEWLEAAAEGSETAADADDDE